MMNLKKLLIENNSILIKEEVATWQEAIKKSTDILVEAGAIEERYYHEILKNTEEYGPYYIIAPGVAMPHARPEAGVIKDCFSLVTLKEPVHFGDGIEEVKIIVTLAATSSENHNEFGLMQVANLFEDEENIGKLMNAENVQEILEIIQ